MKINVPVHKLLPILLLLVQPAIAQTLDYTYSSDGSEISITGYTGAGGEIMIPDTIDSLPVTSIGNSAFEGCSTLTSITIPESVTSIGYNAFRDCSSLTSVTIPPGVTSIHFSNFFGCSSLTNITADALNTSYSSIDGVLFNKSQNTLIQYPAGKSGSYIIPSSVTSIGSDAFSECSSLTSVTIPDDVTSIGYYAFWDCSSLTSVTIPSSVTSIGGSAFWGCSSLSNVTIPSNVSFIGESAFSECSSLTNIMVDALNSSYSSIDGVLFNKSLNTLIQCPGGKSGSYTIPSSVTSIGDNAFSGCSSLSNVTIPSNVSSIGNLAFSECSSLTNIMVDALNSSYSSIDGVLFNKSLNTLVLCPTGKTGSYTIPDGVTTIGDTAFGGCTSLTSVTIPKNVTAIGYSNFLNCSSLTNITADALHNSYSSIDGVLFNKSLNTLVLCPTGKTGSYTIPDGVTTIGDTAFARCTSLMSVTIPSSVTSIGDSAFYRSSLTSVTIPNSVTSIGDYAFFRSSLRSVTIPNSVTSFGGGTFESCSNLSSVTIPNSVTTIGAGTFLNCSSLTSITIPSSVTTIGNLAFSRCSSLTSVYMKGNVPSLGTDILENTPNAVIYYLPGTTGWSATFSDRPTVLWNPQVQTDDASFGILTNEFGFNLTSTNRLTVVVETSESLNNPSWTPASTNSISSGSSYFSDRQWTNHPARYYRLSMP